MSSEPEALAQLARLLGVDPGGLTQPDAAHAAVEARFDALVQGIMAETAASDDVIDAQSGFQFISDRLRFMGALLTDEQRSRLLTALRAKIEAW